MAKVSKDHTEVFFDYDVDLVGRTVYLGSCGHDSAGNESGVEFTMAERCIKGLYLLERGAPGGDKPIKIILATPGGYEDDGMAIYDAIANCKNHVTIIGIGKVLSMGAYIMQAADERVLSPNCTFMFHAGSWSVSGHPSIVKNWVSFGSEMDIRLDTILMNKIKEKNPDFKEKKFKELNIFDHIMWPEATIEMGLADRILRDGELGE